MRGILLKTILSIPLIVLRIIIVIFDSMKVLIESVGGFFLLLFIIPAIWTLFKKDYYAFSTYVFGIVFIILIQIGAEFILNTLIWLYEKIYIYKMEL